MENESKTSSGLNPQSEALSDALLREHARLGSGDDEELISRILVQTVNKATTAPVTPAAAPRMAVRDWIQLGGVVAAVIAVLLISLSMFNVRNGASSDTFHMTVKFVEATKDIQVAAVDLPKPDQKSARPFQGQILPQVVNGETVSSVTIEDQDFNLITHFEQSFKSPPAKATRIDSITIIAGENNRDGDELVFEGNVIVTHHDFVLKAHSLRLQVTDQESGRVPSFTAEFAEISHLATNSKASAKNVFFDTATSSLVAQGVNSLTTSDGNIPDPALVGGQLVFQGENLKVIPNKTEAYANPLPLEPQQ